MSMLKFDREERPDLELERSDFRVHYENVATQTLLAIRRNWRLLGWVVTLALTLALVLLPLLPRKYSATALGYPKLFSSAQEKSVARASIDAASIVTGEARLIVSDAILQAVVKRLDLASDPDTARSPSWTSWVSNWLRS